MGGLWLALWNGLAVARPFCSVMKTIVPFNWLQLEAINNCHFSCTQLNDIFIEVRKTKGSPLMFGCDKIPSSILCQFSQ